MTVKVAGIQMACVADGEDNLKKAIRLGGMAAESGARIICYQPLFTTLWFPRSIDDACFDLAQEEDGPTLARLRNEAARLGVCLILPLFERAGGAFFYTAFVIGDAGKMLGKYRKMHLPDIPLWREKHYFAPGDLGYPVFSSHGIRFGVQICWDNFFPEGARILALAGAEVIFAPTAAAFQSADRWETVLTATAIVNGVYLMRVNRVGRESEQDFYGRSFCVDPDGESIISPIGLHDGVVLADIDPEKIGEVRRQWNFMGERRSETYGALSGRKGEQTEEP